MKRPPAPGTSAKHAGTAKHGGTTKHAPTASKPAPKGARAAKTTAVARTAKANKPVALALGDAVACCAAEALAASLRLHGWPVGEDDVYALHVAAGGTRDRGVSVPAVLAAASASGLAGVRPAQAGAVKDIAEASKRRLRAPQEGIMCGAPVGDPEAVPRIDALAGDAGVRHAASLILGVELPGAHAVLATPRGWWSWGELYDPSDFPEAVVEAAWTVRWPAWL